MWFPNRSDTNRSVEAQKRARSLKFRISVEEELYYQKSENKGADQLRGYCEADLRLCFRLCRLLVFSRGGSFFKIFKYYKACFASVWICVYYDMQQPIKHWKISDKGKMCSCLQQRRHGSAVSNPHMYITMVGISRCHVGSGVCVSAQAIITII